MILTCEECGKVHNISDDKWDDYNIYYKWNGKGSPIMCQPRLLCHKCTDKFVEAILADRIGNLNENALNVDIKTKSI